MTNQIENILSKIIKYGLYAILLTPLAFWPRALYAFLTPKFILFQVLVEIVFAAWLILKCWKPSFQQLKFVSFIAISFISAIFGIDFSRSFWGIGARMTGLFAELHFFAWFLVLASSLNNANNNTNENERLRMMRIADNTNDANRELKPKLAISGISNKLLNWHYYLNFSFFVSLAVAATAFYQNTQWAMAWGSTVFNNPTFVAPYLMFHFFWGLYKTIFNFQFFSLREISQRETISKLKGWVFGAGAAFILLVILLGQIRGAIFGLFIGVMLLGFFLIFSNITARRFKIALIMLFTLLFIGIFNLWIFRNSQFIQNQNISILRRLTQFSLSETTAQTRILAWQTALKGFADRPILGAGPENFNYLFNAHYNPRLLKFGGGGFGETWFDKPHNAFLEILTEVGIIGSIAYLFIWLAVVLALFKLFTPLEADRPEAVVAAPLAGRLLTGFKSDQKILTFILTSAFVSYLVTIFFSFDSFGSWFGLYLFLAFLASHNNANRDSTLRMPRITNTIYSQLASLAIILIIFALLYINYGMWRANIADADALRIFSRDPAQGIVLFKKSLNYFSPYKSDYQFDLIASVAGAVEKGMQLPNLEDVINFSLGETDKSILAHSQDAAKYTDMVRIYNILGTRGRDPEILAQAEAFGNKSLELSPQRQETLYYLARTALLKNDAITAVNLAKQAVLADPDVKQSHWYLGLAYIANNQRQEGIVEIKKALDMGYKPQNQSESNFIKSLEL